MKKKYLSVLLGGMLLLSLTACGSDGDEVKVVNKVPNAGNTKTEAEEESKQENTEENVQEEALTGYIFETDRNGKQISVTTDIEMEGVLAQLGEPVSYFEAPSCAFQGIDKVYTYEHFQIETYPDGDKDMISMIILLDDIEETQEGIGIGMSKEEMEAAYGAEYEVNGGMAIYTKDGKHLSFLVKDDVIESVEYNSAVLDNIEQ